MVAPRPFIVSAPDRCPPRREGLAWDGARAARARRIRQRIHVGYMPTKPLSGLSRRVLYGQLLGLFRKRGTGRPRARWRSMALQHAQIQGWRMVDPLGDEEAQRQEWGFPAVFPSDDGTMFLSDRVCRVASGVCCGQPSRPPKTPFPAET